MTLITFKSSTLCSIRKYQEKELSEVYICSQLSKLIMDLGEWFSVGIKTGYIFSSSFAIARLWDFFPFFPMVKIISRYKLHIAWFISSTQDFRFFGSTVSEEKFGQL